MSKVVKFGGSSLADAEQFKKVADIIHADPERVYVVPSAPGKRFKDDTKVTDLLYQCYERTITGEDFAKAFAPVRERYDEIIKDLNLDISLDDEFVKIGQDFRNGANRDYAASRGEYLNGILLANYLGYEFVDAAKGIFFDHKGNFDADITNACLGAILEKTPKAVIPGFYGALPDGTIKTFSRGGSDFTGSVVAKAVGASLYENWTDVSGFLVADPRIVENPAGIEVITYSELRELSYMGAGVLHEDAIFPVRSANIPINIKNTNAPEDAGTLIVPTADNDTKYLITGIAGKKDFSVISIEKDRMNSEKGFMRRMLQVLENHEVFPEHMPTGIDTVSVVVNTKELGKGEEREKLVRRLKDVLRPDHFEIIDGLALIAVVGRGMRAKKGTATRVFAALSHADINIRMIDQGSSELNIIVGIDEKDFEKAIKVIYDMFILSEQ
ncbi:MAG: aspartate kinase [Oscillospiraceae bacterium]|nr:aspartate kinase [Oscillospiraceae bacterium]